MSAHKFGIVVDLCDIVGKWSALQWITHSKVNQTAWVQHASWQSNKRRAFTLIEVLVVVVIIALLVAVLIPSLVKARDQAKRAVCSSNLHQQAVGMNAYAADHKETLPSRGWKTNTVAENLHETYGRRGHDIRCLANLGILRGGLSITGVAINSFRSWVGKEWNLLYCPKLYWLRDMSPDDGCLDRASNGGANTYSDPGTYWSWGGYNYAVPLQQRGKNYTPEPRSGGSYPRLGQLNVYPREYIARGYWELLQIKQGFAPDFENGVAPRIPQGCQALVSDWSLDMHGYPAVHGNGVNVLYSDGHVKFLQCDVVLGKSESTESYEMWYFYNQRR